MPVPTLNAVVAAVGIVATITLTAEAGYAKASPEWQRMRRAHHTSSRQLGELATRARPALLILYHQSYQFTESTEEDLMREMRAAYQGRFVSGHDSDVF